MHSIRLRSKYVVQFRVPTRSHDQMDLVEYLMATAYLGHFVWFVSRVSQPEPLSSAATHTHAHFEVCFADPFKSRIITANTDLLFRFTWNGITSSPFFGILCRVTLCRYMVLNHTHSLEPCTLHTQILLVTITYTSSNYIAPNDKKKKKSYKIHRYNWRVGTQWNCRYSSQLWAAIDEFIAHRSLHFACGTPTHCNSTVQFTRTSIQCKTTQFRENELL